MSNGTVSVDPQFGIHRLMKLIKGRSSRRLPQEFPVLKRKSPTLWTNSSLCATTGDAPLSVIKQDIEQKKHVSQAATQKAQQRNGKTASENNVSVSHLSDKQTKPRPGDVAGVV